MNIWAKITVSSHFMDHTVTMEIFARGRKRHWRKSNKWVSHHLQANYLFKSSETISKRSSRVEGGVSPATVTGATHPGPGRRAGRPPGCEPPRPGPSAGGAAGGPPPPGRPQHGWQRRKWKRRKRMRKTRQSDYFRLRPGKLKCLRGRE